MARRKHRTPSITSLDPRERARAWARMRKQQRKQAQERHQAWKKVLARQRAQTKKRERAPARAPQTHWLTDLLGKRKRKQVPGPEALLHVALVAAAVGAVVLLLSQPGAGFVLLLCVIGVLAFPLVRLRQRSAEHDAMLRKVQGSVEAHAGVLGRRKAQLVRLDAYGKPLEEPWLKEVDYFVTNHIEPTLDQGERLALTRSRHQVLQFICAQVDGATRGLDAFPNFSDDMNPAQFEVFCAEELRRAGWDARVTAQSHDQGADVVAEKNGMRVVLQCKLYTQPVGNKSVQEVVAAKNYEQAQFAAVVTNNRYTEAAERLASANTVMLLHYRDLQNLESLLDHPISAPESPCK